MYKDIESKAESVLISLYGSLDAIILPVDLAKAFEKILVEIEEGSFADANMSGTYSREGDVGKLLLSQQDPREQKVFIVAHVLGHFLLHANTSRDVFFRNQITELDDEINPEEREANIFAAAVLMPRQLVQQYWNASQDSVLLARKFGVTSEVAEFRVQILQLL